MIHMLSGTITACDDTKITLTTAGIGFGIAVPNTALFSCGTTTQLHIYFHWNQEQGPQLFGFATQEERTIFGLIIGCSGMGPKVAMAVLGATTPNSFATAISTGDYKALSSIHGIGPKKAENLVMQLKDKIAVALKDGSIKATSTSLSHIAHISAALETLGYTRQEIGHALEQLKNPEFKDASFDLLMRKALGFLAKKGPGKSLGL